MKRSIKNVVNITIMVLMIVASVLTFYFASDISSATANNSQMPQRIEMQSADFATPPEVPSGNTGGENDNETPPEMPSGNMGGENDNETPPEMPSGNDSQSDNGDFFPQKPDGENNNAPNVDGNLENKQATNDKNATNFGEDHAIRINYLYYIIFAVENLILAMAVVYFVMSRANRRDFRDVFKNAGKVIIYIISIILIVAILTVTEGFALHKLTASGHSAGMSMPSDKNLDVDAKGATEIEDEQEITGIYTSENSDESALLVKNGGNLTLTNGTLTKTGDSSNTENSEFYGINAGFLTTEKSTAIISDTTISTDATGSNAVFSTGTDAKIYISNSTITTTGSSSARGLDATYGGYIEADNVNITTQGGSCATLATDRGEGTIIAKNSTLETNGAGSPVIYSTGSISISDTKGTANGAQMVVVEGKNSATVENSTLSCSGAGNRNNVDNGGVMIYQSMSGDASVGTGNFTSKNSNLTIDSHSDYYQTAPMFFITNTDAVINLENTTLNFGSNILLSGKSTDEWGTSGSNGANITMNATNQKLVGNVELDNISTLEMNLSASSYKGIINGDNKGKSVALILDDDSSITLTGDSYVTSLDRTDKSKINFNGYTLYVNGEAINS